MDEDRRIECLCCGSTTYEEVYMYKDTEVVAGCSDCIKIMDGEDYIELEETRAYDAYVDLQIDLRREEECGLI